MTSRTIDKHCRCCRTYLFSVWPDDYKSISEGYYCEKIECKRQEIIDKLKDSKKSSDE